MIQIKYIILKLEKSNIYLDIRDGTAAGRAAKGNYYNRII